MCAGHADQLACALGDLKDDLDLIEAACDFLLEETSGYAPPNDWPKVRVRILVEALDSRIANFKGELKSVANLAEET
jgi:hypothetical protein